MSTKVIRLTEGRPMELSRVMKRNGDFNWTIKVKEDDRVTPKNTTGWKMTMPIKDGKNGPIYLTLTTEGGSPTITHTPASGTFLIHVAAATVNTYKFQRAVYDVIIENATGNKTVPFSGEIEVLP